MASVLSRGSSGLIIVNADASVSENKISFLLPHIVRIYPPVVALIC